MTAFTALVYGALLALPSLAAESILTAPPSVPTADWAALLARQGTPAQETTSPLPLTDYNIPFSAIPEQVNPFAVGRGPQSGYNRCNSTTEGASSECQTLVVNSLQDFCVWGSPTADGTIGDVEAAVVAYCSQPGHGTRIMPAGTITGAQFMKTSAYIQVTGTFNQTGINLDINDGGGELDPHGADLLGNPLGGLVYSLNLPSASNNSTYMQATSWNNFVGSGVFCIKLCDPTVTSPNYCENRFDLIGCNYNMPANYTAGTFQSCEGDLQDVVGTYTSDGQTLTWPQPSSLPATSVLPWTPRIPSSSNCQTFSSEELFGGASTSGSASGSAATVTGTSSGSKGSGTGASGASSPSQTGKSSAAGRVSASYIAPAMAALGALSGAMFVLA